MWVINKLKFKERLRSNWVGNKMIFILCKFKFFIFNDIYIIVKKKKIRGDVMYGVIDSSFSRNSWFGD